MPENTVEILLVEDNAADVRLVVEGLKETRVANRLHAVDNGDDALDFLRRRGTFANAVRPDIVVLDLNLPGLDGRAVLREIKQDAELKAIPVLVISSSNAEGDIVDAYRDQANCFIAKPVDFHGFAQVIRAIEHFWFTTVRLPPRRLRPALVSAL